MAHLRGVRRSFSSATIRAVFDAAVEQGWAWRHNGAHVLIQPPDRSKAPVSLSTSASDGANAQAIRSKARRQGLVL